MAWLLVAGAIVAEVAATIALRGIAGAARPLPVLAVVVGYVVSFTLLTFALRTLNVGPVYAVWSGVGTAGVAVTAAVLYGERLNLTAVTGIALIIIGVVVLTSSGVVRHG
jgi:small multidrug resistance pump